MPNHFKYGRSFKIPYRGCFFHSLLELKYAMSVEEEYRYLREPVIIGYNPKTFAVTNYFRDGVCIYTPDFVIRNKSDNTACLVEIKPKKFLSQEWLDKHQTIAQNFIRFHRLDWKFKVVLSEDILLNEKQQERFDLFVKHRHSFTSIFDYQKLDRRYNQDKPNYFGMTPLFPGDELSKKEYTSFVMNGQNFFHHVVQTSDR